MTAHTETPGRSFHDRAEFLQLYSDAQRHWALPAPVEDDRGTPFTLDASVLTKQTLPYQRVEGGLGHMPAGTRGVIIGLRLHQGQPLVIVRFDGRTTGHAFSLASLRASVRVIATEGANHG